MEDANARLATYTGDPLQINGFSDLQIPISSSPGHYSTGDGPSALGERLAPADLVELVGS